MSYRRIYPSKERIVLDGGLDTKYEKTIIPDNESPDCLNVIATTAGVGTREGFQKLNTQAIGSFVGDGLYVRRSNTNSETMIAFAGGSAWQLAATTFTTIASAQSVFTSGFRVGSAQQENHIFFGNGGVIPYKWNGTDWTRHGIYPPTTSGTVASQAVGVLTGEYRYKATWVNSQSVEGDVNPATATFTAAGATLRFGSIPIAPQSYGVSSRRIYRTSAGGATFFRVGTINDNTTTTFDDNNADSTLGSQAPLDQGVPPKYSWILYAKGRLFMDDPSNPNLVWYTELDTPYVVKTTNFLKIGDNASDLVKGAAFYDNSLYVFAERSVEIYYMADASPANWQRVKSKITRGSKSPYGIVNYNDKIFFPAIENGKFVGFGAVQGDASAPSASLLTVFTNVSDLRSDRIQPDMFNVQESLVGNISSIIFKNFLYCSVTFDSGNTQNNRVYVLDYSQSDIQKPQQETFYPWNAIRAAQFAVYSGHLYYISSIANGFIYKLDSGIFNDDGAAIDSYFWTKEYSGYESEYNFHKDFRYANLLLENSGNYNIRFTYRTDSDLGSGTSTDININPGGSLWGTMVWGVDPWGGGTEFTEFRQYLGTSRGKRIQFKIDNKNTINQRFNWLGLNFAYNRKGFR